MASVTSQAAIRASAEPAAVILIRQTAACNPGSDAATARYNAANQVSWTTVNSAVNGFAYDAAGDVVNDNANLYEYDAEGRQTGILDPTTGALTGYIYNAEGQRVEKVVVNGWNTPTPTTTVENEYLLGLGGEQVTVLGQNAAWQWTNVYAGAKQLATYDSGGWPRSEVKPPGVPHVSPLRHGMKKL